MRPFFWSPRTARNSDLGGITAPFARYGIVGTLGKLAVNPIVLEPKGVGIFHGPNVNADSIPPIALFTVPIALFAIPMTLFRISHGYRQKFPPLCLLPM